MELRQHDDSNSYSLYCIATRNRLRDGDPVIHVNKQADVLSIAGIQTLDAALERTSLDGDQPTEIVGDIVYVPPETDGHLWRGFCVSCGHPVEKTDPAIGSGSGAQPHRLFLHRTCTRQFRRMLAEVWEYSDELLPHLL